MIHSVWLPGIVENSVICHGKVMEFYYQISVGTLNNAELAQFGDLSRNEIALTPHV